MIGLPGETDDDVPAIAAIAATAARAGQGGGAGQRAPLARRCRPSCPRRTRLRARRSPARHAAPPPATAARAPAAQVQVAFHDVAASLVEATLAQGGREVAELIEAAWRGGARFDGWSE